MTFKKLLSRPLYSGSQEASIGIKKLMANTQEEIVIDLFYKEAA